MTETSAIVHGNSPERGGTVTEGKVVLDSLWDDAVAATLRPEQLLLYRSNLLGSARHQFRRRQHVRQADDA
jgi:hypothetical protein